MEISVGMWILFYEVLFNKSHLSIYLAYGGPQFGDDVSDTSDSSELFERDVVGKWIERPRKIEIFQNTLNRCFDDIERFVARIQSAALAQRELEQQAHK